MALTEKHWDDLARRGYAIVSGLIDDKCLRSAQDAASRLNAVHPDCGCGRNPGTKSGEGSGTAQDPAFQAFATAVLDPLVLEILETAHSPERIQFCFHAARLRNSWRDRAQFSYRWRQGAVARCLQCTIRGRVDDRCIRQRPWLSCSSGVARKIRGGVSNVSRWTRRCTGGRSSWIASSSSWRGHGWWCRGWRPATSSWPTASSRTEHRAIALMCNKRHDLSAACRRPPLRSCHTGPGKGGFHARPLDFFQASDGGASRMCRRL